MRCATCGSNVAPKRRLNWVLLILLNVWYLPFYFLSKKRCPLCKGSDFTLSSGTLVHESSPRQGASKSSVVDSKIDIPETTEVYSDVSRRAVQAMESAYIVATSKTLDTVISRYEFLSGLHQGLTYDFDRTGYMFHIQRAIDQFKSLRYQTIPEAYQMQLVLEPRSFEISEFYALSLQGVAKRSTEAQVAAIQTLKKDDAKQRRLAKIESDLRLCLNELDAHCKGASSYASVRERLETALNVIQDGRLPQLQ
jgi:hypothetical protein